MWVAHTAFRKIKLWVFSILYIIISVHSKEFRIRAWLTGYFSQSCMRQSSVQLTHPNLFRVWRYSVIQIYWADKKTWKAQMGQIRTTAKSHGSFQNWFESFWCFALLSFSGIGAVHFWQASAVLEKHSEVFDAHLNQFHLIRTRAECYYSQEAIVFTEFHLFWCPQFVLWQKQLLLICPFTVIDWPLIMPMHPAYVCT